MTPVKTQTGKTSVFTTHLSHCCVVRCGTSFSHKCYQHELEARLTKLLPVSWDVSIFCDSFICSLSQIRSLSLSIYLHARTHTRMHAHAPCSSVPLSGKKMGPNPHKGKHCWYPSSISAVKYNTCCGWNNWARIRAVLFIPYRLKLRVLPMQLAYRERSQLVNENK